MMEKSEMHINSDGTKVWRNAQGQVHNEEGPAVIYNDGSQAWYIHGGRHRENGPAGIYADGEKSWRIDGKRI